MMFPNTHGEAETKPIKEVRTKTYKAKDIGLLDRRAMRNRVEDVDEELLAYLQLEAALLVRTPALMLTLKNKAARFLDKYDTTMITYKRRYTLVMSAVTKAMDITPEEIALRQYLKNDAQAEERMKQDKLLTKGDPGHKGFFGGVTKHLPCK